MVSELHLATETVTGFTPRNPTAFSNKFADLLVCRTNEMIYFFFYLGNYYLTLISKEIAECCPTKS